MPRTRRPCFGPRRRPTRIPSGRMNPFGPPSPRYHPAATAGYTESKPPRAPASLPERRPPAVLPPELAAPIKLKPINPAKAGVYTSGIWRFEMKITSPGTRTEGRWGWLTYDGQKLPRGDVNDYYDTPWGPIYWVDVPTTPWGVHGWMPVPLAQNPHKGRPLAVPKALLAAAPAPPTTGTRRLNCRRPLWRPPRCRGRRHWRSTRRTTASWPSCGSATFW